MTKGKEAATVVVACQVKDDKGILAAEAGIAVTSVPFHLRTNGGSGD
ncbi:MAG: hypothetical protein ACRDWF_16860 [Acidimicrobiia bacterium]